MNSSIDAEGPMNRDEEQLWFRNGTILLIVFFVLCGGGLAWSQWRVKRADRLAMRSWLSPNEPDPAVTAAEIVDTQDATQVSVGIYLERIPSLSMKEMVWTVVFDVWFRWRGPSSSPAENLVVVNGSIESKERQAEHHDGEDHYERYQMEAKITKSFSTKQFPLDEHLLLLALENGESVRQRMVFVPDTENSNTSSRVVVPGYVLSNWSLIEKPHSYKSTRGDPRLISPSKSTFSQIRFGLNLGRSGWGLYLKMFQALYVAVAIAFLSCFIKPTYVDPRFGLGVGALFAAVTNFYLVNSFVPDTGELALADVVNLLGTLTILVTLVESTFSLYLYDICGEQDLSKRLDRMSFKVMLGGFLSANLALILAAAL